MPTFPATSPPVPEPAFLFAHGAGLPSTSPWMETWAGYLAEIGPVQRFDYPYMAAGKKRPNRMPVLLESHREALDRFRAAHPGRSVFLIGKSMGSRVGCHLSLEEEVQGLICLGYPLAGMGNRAKLRDAVLKSLSAPICFVQGTRDRLCPLDLLAEVRAEMTAPSTLHVVETGDHSLRITKTHTKQTGETQEEADAAAVAAIRDFVAKQA